MFGTGPQSSAHNKGRIEGREGPFVVFFFFFFCPFSADGGGQAKLAHSKMLKEGDREGESVGDRVATIPGVGVAWSRLFSPKGVGV